LETFGAVFIPESDGIGAGGRLKFMRQDVRLVAWKAKAESSRTMTCHDTFARGYSPVAAIVAVII
jgi:hypothetical protein